MKSCLKLASRLRALAPKLEAAAGEATFSASLRAAQLARDTVPVDSGELKNSISAERTAGGASLRAAAGHAAMVEYGTSRMQPRPFMLPAAQAAGPEFFRMARDGAAAAVKEI